ncbi:Jas TPL-binding domain containing protein [Trema orientale]|uniref:Jas TPL-binding domain containing protein n=1 Tax=Trema orientale TaxID=63057 RepID=A0A2P5AQC3_TREOI|nr:Jas TPL-binding domain containing protein [Trema orientale]
MEKGPRLVNDGDANLSNSARIGTKRSHQWFLDTAESELSPDKKQVVDTVNTKLSSGISYTSVPPWENTASLQSVPNQFVDRLIGSETARSVNFAGRNISSVVTDDLNGRRQGTDNHVGDDIAFGLSVAHEGPETSLSYAGIRKVKVNQVKDCDNGIHPLRRHGSNNGDLSSDQAFDRENKTNYVAMGQSLNKEHDNMMIVGHTYSTGDAHIRSTIPNYSRVDSTITMGDTYGKGDTNIISFSGFPDEQDIIPVGRPVDSYDQLYHHSSVTSETACEKEPDPLDANAVMNTNRVVKPRSDLVSKNKPESKAPKKEAPNSFPSNVRSLISTGMLDGVPVKYVSLAREELRGIIKGSGYLCGCQSCNYSKVLNAYEFERHAGCKTKHPNNHIYFENGKTIYQIVQELRSTPESLLFDTIQTVFGAPINQKSFRIWKAVVELILCFASFIVASESFQAATRELQRIYGKEELNL